MNISSRVSNMTFSSIRKLMDYADVATNNGIKVYPLNIGQPDIITPDTFLAGIHDYKEKIVKYSDSKGILSLRELFVNNYKKWNIDLDPDDILITMGGSEAVLFSMLTICDFGDEIIVVEPFYSNYNSFARIAGATLVPIQANFENNFHLPPKEVFEKAITSKTKAILICNPVNPTGSVYTKEELDVLSEIAIKNNLYIIADEVYREFVFTPEPFTSMMHYKSLEDRVIVIDSISKHYSACGARIGLLASKNKEFMQEVLKLCQSRLCASTIEQYAASNLINTLDSYVSKVKSIYINRCTTMYQRLKTIPGVECSKPEGAFYIFVKLPIDDSDKFAKWLVTDFTYNNETVLLAPGTGFYNTPGLGRQEVRLSYCIDEQELLNALDVLEHALVEYQQYRTDI